MMLGSALAFSAVFTGPWGSLKLAAFEIGSPAWLVFAASFLALNFWFCPAYSLWPSGQGQISSRVQSPTAQSCCQPITSPAPAGLVRLDCLHHLLRHSRSYLMFFRLSPIHWAGVGICWELPTPPGLQMYPGSALCCRLLSCWSACSGLPVLPGGSARSSAGPSSSRMIPVSGVLPGPFFGSCCGCWSVRR